MRATNKSAAIAELVDHLAAVGRIRNRESVLKAVMDRERASSTAIGEGLAIPHGKSEGCSDIVMALGKPATPLEFDARDRRPVDLVILLVSPPNRTGEHIQALSRVSRLMLTPLFRAELAAAPDVATAWNVILKHEK